MASSATREAAVISTAVVFGLYLPLIACHSWTYYINKNHVALKQRYSFITMMELIFSLIYMMIYTVSNINTVLDGNKHYIKLIVTTTSQICYTLIFSFWIWRFWMIGYSMKFANSIRNQQWIYIINRNDVPLITSEWTFNKKQTFGNIKWIRNHFVFPWNIIWILLCLFPNFFIIKYNSNIYTLINWIYYGIWTIFNILLSWIVLFIIYYKTPKFKDRFYISLELKRLFIPITILWIDQIFMYIPINSFQTDLIWIIHSFIQQSMLMLIIMISTWTVLVKLRSKRIIVQNEPNNNKNDQSPLLLIDSKRNSYSINRMSDNALKQVLKNHDTFNVFAVYLSMELSMEFLLGFIEIIQYQQYVWKLRNDIDIDQHFGESLFQNIKFYINIVKSYIVFYDDEQKYGGDLVKNLKVKANKIYKKYIEYGCKHQVVLTNDVYHNIYDIMSDSDWIENEQYDINIVMELLDMVSGELFILLLNAFNRFHDTLEYRKVNNRQNFHKHSLEIDSSTYLQ